MFLIDWNHARKQLRGFLRGGERVGLLEWAAEAEVGHRGFLELGGAKLINTAVQRASDFRQLYLYAAVAGSLEAAADSLKRAGLITRDYLLGNVLGA